MRCCQPLGSDQSPLESGAAVQTAAATVLLTDSDTSSEGCTGSTSVTPQLVHFPHFACLPQVQYCKQNGYFSVSEELQFYILYNHFSPFIHFSD